MLPLLLVTGATLAAASPLGLNRRRSSASSAASAGDVIVFFQNDGNWTSHAEKPSSLFVNYPSSYEEAADTCSSFGETLLGCESFSTFHDQFTYQHFLGIIDEDTLLWSNCSSTAGVHRNGTVAGSGATNSASQSLPFLCTNTAPLAAQLDTDYSVFPRMNATSNGTVFEGLRDHMALRFLGIPFAQSPTGSLRFQYAQAYNGTYVNATHYGTACLQYGYFEGMSYGLNPWGNSEDCLFLNVYTSSLRGSSSNSTLKPVMVWFHGGSQTTGMGSDSTFDGASLVSRSDVVLVVPNYRLNIFGYLTLNDSYIPGNFALSDKIAALEWIQKYITAFGGNPNNITIFGQSAGGGSVIDLVTSPKAAGLFQGAIQQSAGRGHDDEPSDAAATIIPYLEQYCNGTDGTGQARLECLQALPAETLLNITYSEVTGWDTAIDGTYVIDYPISQLAKGGPYINRVNWMGSYMPEEAQALLGDTLSPNETSLEVNMQLLVSSGNLNQDQADAVLASNLWLLSNETFTNGSTGYSNVYNLSVNIGTDSFLTCFSNEWATTASVVGAYDSMWIAEHQRGYALSYYDYYDLCTFPVGEEQPYYRCHSADLYMIFGTAYLFDQPVRVDDDIYYVNAVQDMWASFARIANPNVARDYLEARGYQSTIDFFEESGWSWPQYHSWDPAVASLQYPGPGYTTLPDQRHCEVILPTQELN